MGELAKLLATATAAARSLDAVGARGALELANDVARTAAQVTLSEPHRSEAEYREALDIVASQADRLTRVVDDMFLLALADVDGRPLLHSYLYLDETVAECVRAAGVLAESRRITLAVESPKVSRCTETRSCGGGW